MYVSHVDWRAVSTSPDSFSTLRLRSTSSRTGIARQQHAGPLWRWLFSAACQLFENPLPQERTQLGCGVTKFEHGQLCIHRVSLCHVPRARIGHQQSHPFLSTICNYFLNTSSHTYTFFVIDCAVGSRLLSQPGGMFTKVRGGTFWFCDDFIRIMRIAGCGLYTPPEQRLCIPE